jgi:hypothetical protein
MTTDISATSRSFSAPIYHAKRPEVSNFDLTLDNHVCDADVGPASQAKSRES